MEINENIVAVNISALSDGLEIMAEKNATLEAEINNLEIIIKKLEGMYSSQGADHINMNMKNILEQAKEFLVVSKATTADAELALNTYIEINQKSKDIINAINI